MSKLIFYVNKSDKRQLRKILTEIGTVTDVLLKEDTDILNPTILVSRGAINENYLTNFLSSNYVYLTATNRYYFINNIELRVGGVIAFKLKVDVLQTYAEYIQNVSGIVARNEFIYSPYYIDDKIALKSGRIIERHDISNSFFDNTLSSESNCIALTVNGG